MIIDVHTHLSTREQWGKVFVEAFDRGYTGYTGIDLEVTPEIHWEAVAAVSRAIVFGINSIALGMHTPNDAIAAYAKAHPEKIIGFMSVDPNDPDALDEIDRCVNDLGLKGIKMSPVYQHYNPKGDRARRVHRRAEELGLPILTHAAYHVIANTPMEWANPLLYDPVAREFPNLKIILAHIGLPWYTDAMVMIRKHPNVFADVSGGVPLRPWWGYQALAFCHENRVIDKLLFGSDFPIATIEETIDALRTANRFAEGTNMPQVPEQDIEDLIHRDSLSLLGLD
ncbi:amidohydrolase [Candidatus Poribacteria bacterium]|nr:amidohydrolase [Candidatus Poribacteria bacterium]